MKFIKNLFIQPKNLILIFVITATIIILSVIIELNQSKKEMLDLMQKQSHTLLESMITSGKNALLSYDKIEDEMKTRLLNNAGMIKLLYQKKIVSNSLLESIADKNNIFRINIFDSAGRKIFSSHKEIHTELPEKENPIDYLEPILEQETDTLIIGIKPSRYGDEKRYAVAVATGDGGAIVVNVDAMMLLEFRNQVGFGVLLKSISENDQIEYVALQDEDGIIAASGKLDDLESIESSDFLKKGIESETYMWRLAEVDSTNVFEAIHPFEYKDDIIGLFRLGLSLEPINDINDTIIRRLIILGIVLFIFGSITITLVFARQNFALLSKKFIAIETYAKEILDNVSDAIVLVDNNFTIKSFNNAALQILGKDVISNKNLFELFEANKCDQIMKSPSQLEEVECKVNGSNKVFLVSKSEFIDEQKESNIILVIRDLTEVKKLENQIQRKERMAEMGELASSVAHEIRNPLNAIGTITQQLGKDFEPKNNSAEFSELTKLVYKEVRRINDTIENFLKFARPQPINPQEFSSKEFFESLSKQYSALLNDKMIQLNINESWSGNVLWDITQMKQVFINLFENSIDAVKENGEITINIKETGPEMVEIKLRDNGPGISKDVQNKIFNLYFTTKSNGSGIGLSIVQKIISEHNGSINVYSELGKGTEFIITIPKKLV
ncbi:MAG: PAS domain S-box protein [Ignavibacteria bacterium]|nr:PAS domain S-box protein [Ignavibacteria bacterium]